MIAAMKLLHIAGLLTWCATLVTLPVLLHVHYRARNPREYREFRLITHIGYAFIATPSALVAIAAGTALMFLAEIYDPWFLTKLAFVAGMVLVHMWLGHLVQRSGDEDGPSRAMRPLIGLYLTVPLILTVLLLVLAKPDLGWVRDEMPAWLLAPQGGSL
ncbi:CopD family protein [Niveispirillum sp. KHB5.9]|uniref:CopD family protein n=1 Tax=Niveispirillum sp. KHB5.9 TaxID=3400269 RepID=UPI003A886B0A